MPGWRGQEKGWENPRGRGEFSNSCFLNPHCWHLLSPPGKFGVLNGNVIPTPLTSQPAGLRCLEAPTDSGGQATCPLGLGSPGILCSASEHTGFLGLEVPRHPVTHFGVPLCTRSTQFIQSRRRVGSLPNVAGPLTRLCTLSTARTLNASQPPGVCHALFTATPRWRCGAHPHSTDEETEAQALSRLQVSMHHL